MLRLCKDISTVLLNSPGGVKLHQPQTVTLQNLPVEVWRIELNHIVTGSVESMDRENQQGAHQHTWKQKQQVSFIHKYSALKMAWMERCVCALIRLSSNWIKVYASSCRRNLNAVQEPITCIIPGCCAHLMQLISGLYSVLATGVYACSHVQLAR